MSSSGYYTDSEQHYQNILKLKSIILKKESKLQQTLQHLSNHTHLLSNTLTNYFRNNLHHLFMTLGFLLVLLCIITFMIYSWMKIIDYLSKIFLDLSMFLLIVFHVTDSSFNLLS